MQSNSVLNNAVYARINFRRAIFVAACAFLFVVGAISAANAQTQKSDSTQIKKESAATKRATGTFEVKIAMLATADESAKIVRMSLDKSFAGDLAATSKGEMLADGTAENGSGGYVAIERVSGTLAGRKGTFALQHSGTMKRGVAELLVAVVPESGTGELAGLAGKMTIKIENGKHFYDFEYALPETPVKPTKE